MVYWRMDAEFRLASRINLICLLKIVAKDGAYGWGRFRHPG